MRSARTLVPLTLLFLLGVLLFLPSTKQRLGTNLVNDSGLQPTETLQKIDNPSRDTSSNSHPNKQSSSRQSPRWAKLTKALELGNPVVLRTPTGGDRTFWMRPRKAVGDDFQITLGTERDSVLSNIPLIYEGASWNEDQPTHANFAIVGQSFAAILTGPDGIVYEIHTDPVTGQLEQTTRNEQDRAYRCRLDPRTRIAAISSSDAAILSQDFPSEPVEILPVPIPQGGADPATGNYSKILDTIIGGQLYEASLKDALILVALDKAATGVNTTDNLASKASLQLCRMANISALYEHQIGCRILVQELLLTPDTDEYNDIPASLGDFRSWAENQRPRNQFPRTLGTKVGNGLSGSTLGLGYVSVLKGSHSYSIVRPGYDHALLGHEMGHNFGSGHSDGGVMNASWRRGARDFFKKIDGGETSAKKMYNHAKSRLLGTAPLRHPEQIPFAKNDFARTSKNKAVTIEPLGNDLTAVLNGQENRLSIAELGAVFPIGAGSASFSGGEVTFSPESNFTGIAWFSYTLQGDVGNNSKGWYHKGDIAIQVHSGPSNTELTLRPGDSHIHHPSGGGDLTVESQPQQARADRTADDKQAIVIRVNANATGTDTFIYRKNNVNYTVDIIYAEPGPVTRSDIYVFDTTQDQLRFNPLLNDEIPGTRQPQPIRPILGVGTNGKGTTGENLLPNGFKLISASLLDDEKGTLTKETTPFTVDSQKVDINSGFLKFEPKNGAKGLARIEYIIEDAAGNRKTETIVILLNLVTITSPSVDTAIIRQDSGLLLSGTTHAISEPPLSGKLSTQWSIISSPKNSRVIFDDPYNQTTGSNFSQPGTYTLRLTASDDGGYGTFDEITVKVEPSKTNSDDSEIQPAAHWKLDEEQGTIVRDSGVNKFNGTINGPVWRDGLLGGALEFDGNDDFAELLIQQIILPTGATWKYHDKGTDPGDTWLETNFDDSSWEQGPTQLGYGNDGEKTVLDHGPSPTQKNAANYFRHRLELEAVENYPAARLRFQRDDAAAVYLNGQELFRDSNLPANADFKTYASSTIANENAWQSVHIPSDLFTAGSHTLAVEVHQANATSSDTRFNLELSAFTKPAGEILRLSQGSVSLWIRTTENSRMTLLSAADTLDPDREWKLYLEDGRAHYKVLGDTNADSTPFRADKKLTVNQWHHILLNVDPAKNASFYIDGKWKGQFTLPFFNAVWNSNTLQLGRSLRSTGHSDFFKGQIDDIRIYSRPLFQAEIEALSHANANRGPTFSLPSSKVVTPFDPFDLSLIKPIVQDDGRLNPTLTYSWSLLNGPGSLTFNDASSPTPTIDFEKIGDYKIRLVADDGEIQTFRDLEIEHINGNNDKPMTLGIGDLTLNENANTKAINLHEAFEDLQDTDTQLTFSITANSKPSLFQRLEIKGDPDNLHLIPATGQLGTSNISIRATDREGNFTDTNFSVTVRNQPPNILQQTFYLEENSPAGTIVGTVQAEDPDGDTPIFQIIAGNETGLFTIEPSNGRISLRPDAKVDYETTPSHTLNVAVTDERNPSPENNAEIRIYIVDQNEAPTVADATFNLGDTLKTGELVGPISGSDPEGDSLLFEITSGNEDGLFAIDANGILSIAKQATLDPSQEPRRTLVVRASDTGRPSLSGTGNIRINISRQAVGRNSSLLYLVPDDDSVDNIWMQTDFDDSEWDTGKLGLGYDTNADYDDVISTDLLTLMRNKATTAFARIPFQVPNTVAVGELRLRYAYDDGCIVYLNGQKILSHNAPPNPTYTSSATAGHEAVLANYEEIDLTSEIKILSNGTNVLAVQLLNDKNNSSDLLFDATLLLSAAGTPIAPNPSTIEATGSGIAGRTTAKPSGRVVRKNGEQPSLTLVLDTADQGKSVSAWARHFELPTFSTDTFSIPVDQLIPNTTYYYAFYGTNRGGVSWTSTANSFTTRANQPPTANPDTYTAVSGVQLTVSKNQGVLSNDSDQEQDSLSARILTEPANGNLVFQGDGSFNCRANPGFKGTDRFTYITRILGRTQYRPKAGFHAVQCGNIETTLPLQTLIGTLLNLRTAHGSKVSLNSDMVTMMKKRISPLAAIHVKKLPPTTSATVSLCQKGQRLFLQDSSLSEMTLLHYTSTVQKSFEITTSLATRGITTMPRLTCPTKTPSLKLSLTLHYFCPVIT